MQEIQPNQWNGVPDDVLKQYNLAYTEKELKECVSFNKMMFYSETTLFVLNRIDSSNEFTGSDSANKRSIYYFITISNYLGRSWLW